MGEQKNITVKESWPQEEDATRVISVYVNRLNKKCEIKNFECGSNRIVIEIALTLPISELCNDKASEREVD